MHSFMIIMVMSSLVLLLFHGHAATEEPLNLQSNPKKCSVQMHYWETWASAAGAGATSAGSWFNLTAWVAAMRSRRASFIMALLFVLFFFNFINYISCEISRLSIIIWSKSAQIKFADQNSWLKKIIIKIELIIILLWSTIL